MCALNGIFPYTDTAAPVGEAELLQTRDHMYRRGPDGAGAWISADGRIGLAHRRLAIIDLSADGAQPMATADGRYQIVFNGEIYNYRELQKELKAQGVVFRSQSDTEVLLHLFARYREGMCRRLRGMFAFAIWDSVEQSLFLARDSFGIKPLYIHDDGLTLRFASQVKALVAGGRVSTMPCEAGELGYWTWGHVPEPHTIYKEVKALPPGSWRRQPRNGRVETGSYETVEGLLSGEATSRYEDLHDALLDSVRHHLIADVPVGIFLSAGIDSALITALAAEAGSALTTVTLGFEEFRGTAEDETVLAEKIAAQYGAQHQTVWITKADFDAGFADFIEVMDQPSIDGLNTWLVSRAASRLGMKVALSGLGGDEFFGGYPSFHQIPRMRRASRHFAPLPGLARMVRRVARPFMRRLGTEKLAGLLEYGHSWDGAYSLRRAVRMPWEPLAESSSPSSYAEPPAHKLGDDHAMVSHLEATRYMRNQLLRDSDWASMAHSLELRVPFVDTELIRHIAFMRKKGTTYIKADLASAAHPPLSREVANRPKTGFMMPMHRWAGLVPQGQQPNRRSLQSWQALIHRSSTGREPLQRKRILLLTTDAYGGHGGIGLYNRDIVDALAEMPEISQITVLARHMRWQPEGVPAKADLKLEALGGKLKYLTTAVKASLHPHDLLICGHINLLPLAALVSARARVPLVLMVYGIDVWGPAPFVARQALKRVRAVWSISQITTERMSVWAPVPREAYVQVPNAIHLERYGMAPRRYDLQQRHGLNDGEVIMTLARLPVAERYKGVDEVLEALPTLLKRRPRLKYLVCGEGNDRPRLMAKARSLGIADAVVFTGMIDERDKADYFRLADAFAMPGRGEGFGFVFLEALACGVPVMGSKLDGSREALRDGLLGELVDPGDATSVIESIERALSKPKLIPEGLTYFAWPQFQERLSIAIKAAARDSGIQRQTATKVS